MRTSRLPAVLALLGLLSIHPAAATKRSPGESVALVYALAGTAVVTAPAQASRPLRLFDRLPAGTAVEVGPGSRLALAFMNGLRYELDERSRVTLGSKDLTSRAGPVRPLPRVPPLPRLAPIAEDDHPGRRFGAVRIRGYEIDILSPREGAATLASATVLRFEPVDGAVQYRIEIQDRQGTVVYAAETASPLVSLPAGALLPGMRYVGSVRTVDRVGPVARGEAAFSTLPREVAAARETLRKAVEKEGDGALPVLLEEIDRSLGLLPALAEPDQGAVVEEVAPGSSAERAGIRPGDLLLSWTAPSGSGGPVGNPFDLGRVAIEQAPRGEVTLRGRREGREGEWTILPGSWGAGARPTFRDDLLSLYEKGRDLIAAGDLDAGIARWRSALETTARRGDSLRAAWFQGRLARAFADANRWNEADAAWEVSVQSLQGAEPSAAAQLLRDWGETLKRRNEWDRAVEIYRRAQALTPGESLAAGSDLSSLGEIASRRGNLAMAEELFLQAHALWARLAPGDRTLASSETNLAIIAARRGRLDHAEKYFLKVLEREERLAAESLGVARALANLGNLAMIRGDLATAEERYRWSLAIVERLEPDSQNLASKLGNLGYVELLRGDLAVAEEHLRRALAIDEKVAPESLEVASRLNYLGILADKRGDFTASGEYHRRALAIHEKRAPGSPEVAASLANLGWVEARRGHLESADEHLRRAFEIQQRAAPGGLPTVGPLAMRADVAKSRGDLALAEQLHGRALAILEKQAPASLRVSDSLASLGEIALEKGDMTLAEALFRRSLAIREMLAPGSSRLGAALNNLGQVHRRRGRRDLAARHFCDALDALDRQRTKVGGTTEERSAFGGTTAEYYQDCAVALVETGRPEEAFHVLERGRARSFLDLLADRDLRSELPPDLARARRETDLEYDRTQKALELASPVTDPAEVDRLLVRLRGLRARHAEIAARARQASPRAAELNDPQPLDLAGARKALDPGTLLLSWSIGRDSSLLFAVLPAGAPSPGLEVFPLPVGETVLRQRVESFRNLLRRADSDRGALTAQARELYDLLLRPAEAWIAAADRLLLSPDGPLHTLPFATLVRDGRWLAEQRPVLTVLSATVFAQLKMSRLQEKAPAPPVLVAFGDPAYPPPAPGKTPTDAEVRAAVGRGLPLSALPASREEVRDIAAFYPAARVLLGEEATEERAKAIGEEVRYLHFACHGLLDERFPLNSALALAIPERVEEGRDNGLLQAWEIIESVRLNADLVTLSACDTGLGQELGGEGLLGLTRAFQYAGARTVLGSLWSVADESTAGFMKRFYGYLREGKPKDEALRLAQIDLIRMKSNASHPFHWAAFQLAGDWR